MASTVDKQIGHFSASNVWEGGYLEGDPLDPMGPSGYSVAGYMSVLHATYLVCIKPYITSKSRVIEIGPGRGAWTRALLPAKEVVCLDAMSSEHNRFWEYIGSAPHVKYFQVSDFSCSDIEDNHFDYLFSFGTFCHISPEGSREYFRNLFRKLTSGANAFVMIADDDKWASAKANVASICASRACTGRARIPARFLWRLTDKLHPVGTFQDPPPRGSDEDLDGPRWRHLGRDRACTIIEEAGFNIVSPDVGTIHRDVIVHFSKA